MTVPHKTKISIIQKLVDPESLKATKSAWGREVKLLNDFLKRYPDETFWSNWGVGYPVRSLAWFKGGGAPELENAWRMHLYMKAHQTQQSAARSTKPLDMESMSDITGGVTGEIEEEQPPLKKRDTVLAWADSI